jgi:flagellum-specific peptidoglycan hydrolase FlgJ
LLRHHYPSAFAQAHNGLQLVTHLRGYATDPNYVRKLQAIIRQHDLQKYDHIK